MDSSTTWTARRILTFLVLVISVQATWGGRKHQTGKIALCGIIGHLPLRGRCPKRGPIVWLTNRHCVLVWEEGGGVVPSPTHLRRCLFPLITSQGDSIPHYLGLSVGRPLFGQQLTQGNFPSSSLLLLLLLLHRTPTPSSQSWGPNPNLHWGSHVSSLVC